MHHLMDCKPYKNGNQFIQSDGEKISRSNKRGTLCKMISPGNDLIVTKTCQASGNAKPSGKP